MPSPVPRLTNAERDIWETHEPVIRRLYETQRKTLKEVKQIMEKDYAFPEMSLWMYETKLRDKFKLRKKLRKDDWPIVYQHFRKRDGRKDTGVYLNGTEIPWKKAWKEMRRSGALSASGSRNAPPPLPDGVDVRTPSPSGPSTPHVAPLNEPASVRAMVPSPNFAARSLQAHACQPMPRVPHEGVPLEQHLESAVFLDPGLMTYKIFLETIPWKRFIVTQLAKVNNWHQLPMSHEKLQQSQFELAWRTDFLNLRSSLHPFNILKFKSSPAASALRDEIPASTAVALEFNTYHFLARAIYELSNNLSTLPYQRPELFKILFERISRDILYQLLASDLPTARAAWESIIYAAYTLDYRNEFIFFIEIGIQHPDWILSDGDLYISIAASMNTPNIVQRLLEIGACPGKNRSHDFSPRITEPAIIYAVFNGNPECAMLLANRCVDDDWQKLLLGFANERFSQRSPSEITRPAVCLAAKQGKEALSSYLKLLYPMNSEKGIVFLELMLAEQFIGPSINDIDLKLIRLLLEFGVKIKLPSVESSARNPLIHLVEYTNPSNFDEDLSTILQLLLEQGADIDQVVLEMAVPRTGLGHLQILVHHGADIKNRAVLALSTAVRWSNHQAVSWLLEAGVNINAEIETPEGSFTVIAHAIHGRTQQRPYPGLASPNCNMIEFVLRHGAQLQASPIGSNDVDFLIQLLGSRKRNDNPTSVEILGVFFHFGTSFRDVATSQADLLEACLGYQNLNYPGDFNHSRLDLFELLLRHGASATRGSPLSCLINAGGRDELVLELLTAGADVNAYATTSKDWAQFTPIQAAAARGNLKLVLLLVQNGADINKPPVGRFGRTTLQTACDWDHSAAEDLNTRLDLIRFLVNQGAEINYSKNGVTALEIAAFRGHLEVVVMLLDHGAILNRPPINATNGPEDKYSALDFAASGGRLDVVQLILSAGAVRRDPGKTGYDGAIAHAERKGLFAVASLIRNHVQFCGGI
ncbi:hypothetical protein BKA56DRAFT_623343 [Ilyonectria sp. MPI-CAGE-AT-0026]|nr:hypothetical protein BKA56DRAFT_623343 [Ilyonectria sp. MPI-CAGE-AT-0026]